MQSFLVPDAYYRGKKMKLNALIHVEQSELCCMFFVNRYMRSNKKYSKNIYN